MKPQSEIQKHRQKLDTFLFILNNSPNGSVDCERALREAAEIMQESATTLKAVEAENEEIKEELRKFRGDFYRSIIK